MRTIHVTMYKSALYILKSAYDKKKITDEDINIAVGRLFGFRLKSCHVIMSI